MYETSGIIDRAFYLQIKKYLMPKKNKRVVFCCCIFIFIGMIASIILEWLLTFIIAFFGLLILCLTYFLVIRRTIKLSIERLKETTHKESYKVTTRFGETGVMIMTDYYKEERCINYNNINNLVETTSYYLLFTKALQLIVVFKEQLTDSEKKDLVYFLKSKSIKIDVNTNFIN